MPTKPCPDCGREVSTLAEACPQCGRPFREASGDTGPSALQAAKDDLRGKVAAYDELRWSKRTPSRAPSREGPFLQTLNCGCVVVLAPILAFIILALLSFLWSSVFGSR